MLFRMLNRLRHDPLRAQVEESIRAGTGLHKGEWLLAQGPRDAQDVDAVGDAIVAWCREQMQGTRRPYGIDQMALAVACAVPDGQPIASATFGVFRPIDFYREGGVSEQVSEFMRSVPLDQLPASTAVRFAAALFSWGDVARDTIYRDDRAAS
jgi:hypothetical protein